MTLPSKVTAKDGASVEVRGHTVRVAGIADDGGWLFALLRDVHVAALTTGMREVVLDIRGLAYANAGTLRALVGWMRLVRGGEAYRLRVLADPGQHRWQKLAVPELAALGAESVVVR